MNTFESKCVTSGCNAELLPTLFGSEEKGADAVEDFINPAFFACSAANVERTDFIICWEELEAASMSATSAAVGFLLVCPGFVVASFETGATEDFESAT